MKHSLRIAALLLAFPLFTGSAFAGVSITDTSSELYRLDVAKVEREGVVVEGLADGFVVGIKVTLEPQDACTEYAGLITNPHRKGPRLVLMGKHQPLLMCTTLAVPPFNVVIPVELRLPEGLPVAMHKEFVALNGVWYSVTYDIGNGTVTVEKE